MRKAKFLKSFGSFAGILLLFLIGISCERIDYEIMDPSTAGTWTLFNTSDGLPGNSVTDIQLDSRNNLWFTFAGQGVAMYSQGIWHNYKISDSPLLSNTVSCLAETSDGSMIFGTPAGLSVLTETNVWDSALDTITSTTVTALKVTSDGTIWVGTSSRGFFVNDGSGFVNPLSTTFSSIYSIEEDRDGNIWIGTGNALLKYDGIKYTIYNYPDLMGKISSLRRDNSDRLWIGVWGKKNVRWIDKSGLHELSLLTGRDSCFINDIYEDRRGNIWFATTGDGVICYDGIVPKKFSTGNLFPENTVRAIGEDKSGNIWFGLGSKGVVRYTLPIN